MPKQPSHHAPGTDTPKEPVSRPPARGSVGASPGPSTGKPRGATTARGLATEALGLTIHKNRALDGFFDGHVAALTSADRAHAKALAWGALRHFGALRAQLSSLMDHPLPERARRADLLLIVGLTDLLIVGAAPHAVVDETVKLAKQYKECARYAGLINAILRRVARDLAGFQRSLAAEKTQNIPPWLRKRWQQRDWPIDALADCLCGVPALDLTLASREASDPLLALGGMALSPETVRLPAQDPTQLPGFEKGAFWIQDAAAALPVRLLPVHAGDAVLDLCAAPGGKTLQLARQGARVTALDRSEARLKRLQDNLARTALAADMVTADGTQWRPEGDAPFDHILVDAPCTALGTFRRHPDVLLLRSEKDITGVGAVQARLLRHAFSLLKTGGTLIYCVCSLEPEEGADQITRFLTETPSAAIQPVMADEIMQHLSAHVDAASLLSADGTVLTRPDLFPAHAAPTPAAPTPAAKEPVEGGMDGFYIARITKQAAA